MDVSTAAPWPQDRGPGRARRRPSVDERPRATCRPASPAPARPRSSWPTSRSLSVDQTLRRVQRRPAADRRTARSRSPTSGWPILGSTRAPWPPGLGDSSRCRSACRCAPANAGALAAACRSSDRPWRSDRSAARSARRRRPSSQCRAKAHNTAPFGPAHRPCEMIPPSRRCSSGNGREKLLGLDVEAEQIQRFEHARRDGPRHRVGRPQHQVLTGGEQQQIGAGRRRAPAGTGRRARRSAARARSAPASPAPRRRPPRRRGAAS